ncbi:MAG: response regulator transcription factor [Chloroflexota bacterium]|nr:response regulator transcription factor [Chloroflexota bacterium]
MVKVLVVDDDPMILRMLKRGLSLDGYEVELAANGQDALRQARQRKPDLVILDVMLPDIGLDGLAIARLLRKESAIPILMLTAKDTVPDRVSGLEAGADDYLVKPFAFDELTARIKALLRRSALNEEVVTAQQSSDELTFANLTLRIKEHRALREGRSIELTAREFELLKFFLRHPRQVLSRDLILENVWEVEYAGESNVVDVHIRSLRDKLEASSQKRLIQTVRGVGYVLRED